MVFSLKSKLIIFTLAISLMISGSIVTTALIKQNESIHHEFSIKAITLSNLVSKSVIDPIYELRIHLLTEILSGAIEDEDVVTAWAIDTDELIISDGTEENALEAEPATKLIEYMRKASVRNSPVVWGESEDLLAVVSPVLTPNDEVIGFVYLALSLERANQAVRIQLVTLTFLSIVLFLVGVLIAFLAARKLVKPIDQIRQSTHKIAAGDFNTRLNTESRDELGELAADINNMCRQLQRTTVSRNYVNNVIDSMYDSLFVIDDNGLIVLTNLALRRLLGYNSDELIGKSANYLFSDQVFSDNRIIEGSDDIHFKLKSSELIPINLSTSRLSQNEIDDDDDDDDQFWVVANAQDIREQKSAAEKLREAVFDAQAAALAKGQFLSTMSHEIRTPMNGIVGMTQLLKRTSLDETQSQFLEVICESTNKLLDLINDILDFSRLDASMVEINPSPINLKNICQGCYELMAVNASEKNLELNFDYDAECPLRFMGDPLRLRQICLNLLNNAVKFTKQGHIRFSVRCDESVENGQIIIEVEDTGIGFAEDLFEQFLENFTQADQKNTRIYGGTGLGLAITKKLVDLMGGEIGAKSTPGKGSLFWIKIHLPPVEDETIHELLKDPSWD